MNLLNVTYSSAHIYRYVDKDGIECFTDSLQSIPEEYRKNAVVVNQHYGREDNNPKTLTEEKKGIIRSFQDNKLFKTISAIAVFIIAFIIVGKIGSYLGYRQLSIIIRIVLAFLFYFIYSICISRRWLAFLSH